MKYIVTSAILPGTSYFRGKFSLQDKDGRCLYQVPPKSVAYALQEPLKEELERL